MSTRGAARTRRGGRPAAVAAAAALLMMSAAACQPPAAPSTPAAPSSGIPTVPTPPVQRVAVTGPAGRGEVFTPGETIRFRAAATFTDDRTADCTASAAWAVSDATVLRPGSQPGEMMTVAAGRASVSATCGGQTGALAVSVGSGLRTVGLQSYVPFMLLAERPVVSAELVDASGSGRACRAVWATTDYDVAHVDSVSTTGTVVSWKEGEALITATCEGQSVTTLVKSGTYRLQGVVRDVGTGVPIAGVALQRGMGRDAVTNVDGAYTTQGQAVSPLTWIAWRNGYEVAVKPDIAWDRQPVVTVDWELPRIPGILLEGSGELCWQQGACAPGVPAKRTYAFTVPAAGTLRVDTFWALDYNDLLYHELRCNQEVVAEGRSRDHNLGKLFEILASPSCAYELSFVQSTRNPVMSYDYTISWR